MPHLVDISRASLGWPAESAAPSVPTSDRIGVAIHWGGVKAPPTVDTWQSYRQYHLSKGWIDLGYNFGVLWDDFEAWIAEGRGHNRAGQHDQGAHATGANRTHYGICFPGTDSPPAHALDRCARLIQDLEQEAGRGLRVEGHHHLTGSSCPGPVLLNHISTGRIQRIEGDNLMTAEDRDMLFKVLQKVEALEKNLELHNGELRGVRHLVEELRDDVEELDQAPRGGTLEISGGSIELA